MTFEPTTLRSLFLVFLFGGVEFASVAYFLVGVSPFFCPRQNSIRHPQLMIGFLRMWTFLVVSHRRRQCLCCANQMQARLASLESDELFPCTKGCPDRWSRHASSKFKLESSKSEYNFLNGYVHVYLFHASVGVFVELMTPSSQR